MSNDDPFIPQPAQARAAPAIELWVRYSGDKIKLVRRSAKPRPAPIPQKRGASPLPGWEAARDFLFEEMRAYIVKHGREPPHEWPFKTLRWYFTSKKKKRGDTTLRLYVRRWRNRPDWPRR